MTLIIQSILYTITFFIVIIVISFSLSHFNRFIFNREKGDKKEVNDLTVKVIFLLLLLPVVIKYIYL